MCFPCYHPRLVFGACVVRFHDAKGKTEAAHWKALAHFFNKETPQKKSVCERDLLSLVQISLVLPWETHQLFSFDPVFCLCLTLSNKNHFSWSRQALQYATEKLRSNPAVVLRAVTQDGRALEYASESMRRDRMIVMTAVVQVGENYRGHLANGERHQGLLS